MDKERKKVYDAQKKKTVKMPFYRLNVIDFYNKNMGNVDLADQLGMFIDMTQHGIEIESGGGLSGGGDFNFCLLTVTFFTKNFILSMTVKRLYLTMILSNRSVLLG